MKVFLECLRQNKNNGRMCREESKKYLQCRMDKELMAKEEWRKLGYADKPTTETTATETATATTETPSTTHASAATETSTATATVATKKAK